MTSRSSKADQTVNTSTLNESYARPSICILMIRHAESRNNQVYRDARRLFHMGTDQSDVAGWESYVNQHRRADPDLSEVGILQADALADYLVPLLRDCATVTDVVVSPMRRTLETIRPTVQCLQPLGCHVIIHGFYFETEGCHTNGIAEEGMNPSQIEQILFPTKPFHNKNDSDNNNNDDEQEPSWIHPVGFPNDDPTRGWWTQEGSESRTMAEERAAKFYVWLCEHLDEQLANPDHPGIFDAGVVIDTMNNTNGQHNTHRQRKTQLLIGHGDFMSLVLKRIVAGFGHCVETPGIPHRSAFVHWNTGITELEYFGQGRFLIMSQNATPHLHSANLMTGGSLKDGWSFLMPHDFDDARVDVVYSDQELDGSVVEQKEALKALYLSSNATIGTGAAAAAVAADPEFSVEESDNGTIQHFVVRQGLQVVGVATYSEATGRIFDVAVRPSASKSTTEMLFNAVKDHAKRFGRSGSLLVKPRTEESMRMFESVGFRHYKLEKEDSHMEYQH